MNPAFRHLETKLRIGDLTIRQWVTILVGVMIALLYADLIHPFGLMLTLASAVYIGGIPVAIAIVSGSSEFDAWLVLRSAIGGAAPTTASSRVPESRPPVTRSGVRRRLRDFGRGFSDAA